LEWPALVAESRDCSGGCRERWPAGNSHKKKADDLAAEVEEIIRDHKPDRLRKRIEHLARLYYEIVMATPDVVRSVPENGKAAAGNVRPGASRATSRSRQGLFGEKTTPLACKMSSGSFGNCCHTRRLKKQSAVMERPSCVGSFRRERTRTTIADAGANRPRKMFCPNPARACHQLAQSKRFPKRKPADA